MVNKSKNKDDKIVVRIDAELKEQFIKYVENKGATVSDYVRQMIVQEISGKLVQDYIDVFQELEILKENMLKLEKRIIARRNQNKE